jgi:hypothetical protein
MVLRSAGLELSVAGLETKDDIDGDLDNVAIQSVDAVEHVQETDSGAGILVLVGAVATARPAVAILANIVVGAGLELSAASLEAKDNIDGNLDNIAVEKVDAVKEVEETNGSALVLVLRGAVVTLVPAATLVAVFAAAGAGHQANDDVDGNLDSVAVENVNAVKEVEETNSSALVLVLRGAVVSLVPAATHVAVFVAAGAGLQANDDVDRDLDNIAVEDIDTVENVDETNSSASVLVLRGAVVALVPAATLVAVFVAAVAGLQAKDDVDRDLDNIAVENINTVENVQQTNGSASVLVLCRAVTALVPAIALLADIVAVGAAAELSGSSYDRADEGTHKGSSSEELHVERRGRIERR